jgi:hypothetical protein
VQWIWNEQQGRLEEKAGASSRTPKEKRQTRLPFFSKSQFDLKTL